MQKVDEFYVQIVDHLKLAKSNVTSIIYCHNRQPKHLLNPLNKSAGHIN